MSAEGGNVVWFAYTGADSEVIPDDATQQLDKRLGEEVATVFGEDSFRPKVPHSVSVGALHEGELDGLSRHVFQIQM
eukprot:scaffold28121_cov65-Skeletonema_marinoi.AAC.2